LLRRWLNPDALGKLDSVTRQGTFATALARIEYDDGGPASWLVVLKSCLSSPPPIPLDVQCYAKANTTFPNQSTVDQFFNDDQWESYRLLGETLTCAALSGRASDGVERPDFPGALVDQKAL